MNDKPFLFTRFYRNIRMQLALWNTFFFFSIITGLAGYFYFSYENALFKDAIFFLGHEAQEVASILKRQPFGPEVEQWIIKELSEKPEYSTGYQIYDTQGRLISHFADSAFKNVLNLLNEKSNSENREIFFSTSDPQGNMYHVAAYVASNDRGEAMYEVFVGSYLKAIHKKLHVNRKKISWILPSLFLMALIYGWSLAGIVLSPVRRITEKMEAITVKKLDERLRLRGSGDDLDRLASTFNTMLARIQDSYERVSQFTSGASHELKTPISIMKNQIEVTLGKTRDISEYQDVLISHLEELDRLSQLIDRMLFLARADIGQIKLRSETILLDSLLDELWEFFEPFQASKNIELVREPSGKIMIQGDRTLLRQLLFNLVDNAIRYNRSGGKVRIAASASDHDTVIRISDTGCGIGPEHLDKIFDRFYRVDPSRSAEVGGYGLGLAVCKAIVLAHDGTLDVTSTLGQGTTFTVIIPS